MEKRKLFCDTCKVETEQLRRDVLDLDYNALKKTPIWNCESCYQKKRRERLWREKPMSLLGCEPIFLCGFMATGKSKVGHILAQNLDRVFLDTDALVEERLGKSISEIFEQDGEIVFRQYEHECIVKVSKMLQTVISLGGGAILQESNWEVIQSTGICLCLRASAETIFNRIARNSDRPLLRGLDDVERMQKIKEMLNEREEYYSRADFFVTSTEKRAPEETANIAIDELAKIMDQRKRDV